MDGTMEPGSQNSQSNDCSFVWDENSQLYFHASTGFYHDPNAGWYYSSHDGHYYKFENGSYVLLESESDKGKEIDGCHIRETDTIKDETCTQICYDCSDHNFSSFTGGDAEGIVNHIPENNPPPSEWLEDTLIDLYLSGYSKLEVVAAKDETSLLDDVNNSKESTDGKSDSALLELEEGEWLPEDDFGVNNASESTLDEDASWDEDNWRAQYGQVIQSEQETIPDFLVVDLWDWAAVTEPKRGRKGEVTRLVGRLVRRTAKRHPSMPSGGSLLKTAPICAAHLDLVRVTTGKLYKLRNPSAKYLSSLSSFDSSNPTKDWGYPELSVNEKIATAFKLSGCELQTADEVSTSQKQISHAYRDRAAERRRYHGGFGVGPGQKNSEMDERDQGLSSSSGSADESAAQALNMSFGAGSYARRILEGMGWKEGEGLGNSRKGLVKPIQAHGNMGNAGLGWHQGIKQSWLKQ